MEVEDMTADLEDMDMDMGGPETTVAGGYWEVGIVRYYCLRIQ